MTSLIKSAPQAASTLNTVTAPGQAAGGFFGNMIGGQPGEMVGRYLGGKAQLSLMGSLLAAGALALGESALGIGGAGAAGGTGAGGGWALNGLRAAAASPIGQIIGGGAVLGGLGAEGVRRWQKSHGDGLAADSFSEMLGNTWARMIGGQVSQSAVDPSKKAAFDAAQKAANPFAPLLNVGQTYKNQLAHLGANSWANQLNRAPGAIGAMGSGFAANLRGQMGQMFSPKKINSSTWAKHLDEHIGRELRERSARWERNLQRSRDELGERRDALEAKTSPVLAELAALKKELFEGNRIARQQLDAQKETTRATGAAASRTLARALAYDAQDDFLVGSRVS